MKLLLGVALIVAVAAIGGFYMFVFHMPGQSYRERPPTMTAGIERVRTRLEHHVQVLSRDIGERNYWNPANMRAAADYIEGEFRTAGYEPRRQAIVTARQVFHNIEVRIPGKDRSEDVLVIGAHYDTVRGTPGADDNASGAAVLLELARLLRGAQLDRSVHLVGFANEEDPFYGTDAMGSLNYARRARVSGEHIVGMISLEMLGYYTGDARTQRYPPLLGYFYPDQGDFIAFVGNLRSRHLVYETIGYFREYATVPSEGLAAPELLEDIMRSDHWAFWQTGYPALMVTDTANFRNPNYHQPSDTWETLDYAAMARVTDALSAAIRAMANRGSN